MPLHTFHDTTPSNKPLEYTVRYHIIPEQPDMNDVPGVAGAIEIVSVWFKGKRARVRREVEERIQQEIEELEGIIL